VHTARYWNNPIRYAHIQKIGAPNNLKVFRSKKTKKQKKTTKGVKQVRQNHIRLPMSEGGWL
jgi:hypothetical protein